MKKNRKIIMIEDSKDDALLIMHNISKEGFKPVFERVDTPESMETALNSKDWDIILSDYNMPNFSGLDALKIFKKKNLQIPFIIISGTIGEDLAIETIRKGASDYLMKDNLARLIPSIKRGLEETRIKKERENAIKELVKSEKRFKELAELSPAMIIETDLEGKITFTNRNVYELTGYSIEDFNRGKHAYQLVIPEDRDKVKSDIQKDKKRDINEYTALRKGGKRFPVIVYKDNIYNDKRNKIGLRLVIVDIDELKKTEKALIQSEERLKSFMNSATELFSIWDSEVNLAELNKAAIKMFSPGAKRKDLIGKNILELIPGIKGTSNYDRYLEVMRTGKSYYHEQSTPPQLGNRNLAVKAFKVGKGLGMLTTDITERKKAEDAIKNLAKFPTENPNPVIRINFEGKIIFVNEACKKKLKDWKCKIGNFIPNPIYDLVKNKLKDEALKIDIISGKKIFEFFVTPIKGEGYINLYGRSITARMNAEDKLRKSYTKLQSTLNGTINALASIVETNDPYTSGHQKRVAFLAIAISEELGLDQTKIEAIGTAALIHDIGKINVPASILSKPGKLSDIEFEMIKRHPKIGYSIIKDIEFPSSIEDIVLQHHERLNGSGYPNGLKNKDIILEARILGVADVVEAMSSHRPYRPSLGLKKALNEVDKGKRKLYDSKVVDACINIIVEKKYKF